MIFIVSTNPFGAVQLQAQLKANNQQLVEIFLSAEEAEQNLYKVPDLIILDNSLELTDLLYLTQSIKAYDPGIQILWLCNEEGIELRRMYKSYGVSHCLNKGEFLLEQISLIYIEARENCMHDEIRLKRIAHLRRNIFQNQSDLYSLL